MAGTANSIITPQTPKSAHINQSFLANSTYSASPTNTALLVTAGANGSRLTKLRAIPAATVTVTQLQEFRSLDGGATKKFTNAALGAPSGYTMAATTLPPLVDFGYSDDTPKVLAPGEQLYVACGVAGSWSFEAEWADF
ncbi:MAG TPA: hypothetical protein VNW53_15040 [Phenylobacterium sp.]|jgi:hypothetical protein|uniref:hypothetical protein n=1 Tax=Phenylobacterium sp. TaxID=1871053 RepID=UPI002BBA72DE|nr:hypothetical protein [Phenylobacterium sp.]HXA40311.1 hypothetical protein [Phenylobacterium sp.]